MSLLSDLLETERKTDLPETPWNEQPQGRAGFGSVGWMTPSRYALLSAAAQMAAGSGNKPYEESTTSTLARLAGSIAQGAIGGTQYQQQVEREGRRAEYLKAQTAAQQNTARKNLLWSSIPDSDPIFRGLSPEQIRTLKGMSYAEGSKALGKYRMDDEAFAVLNDEQKAELGLDPRADFRINRKTNKVERIGAPGSTTTINVGDTIQEGMSELAVDRVAGFQSAADEGRDLIDKAKIMQGQLIRGEVDTGALESATLPIRRVLDSAGITQPGLSEEEAFSAAESYMVPRMRVTGSGATSDMEINLFSKTVPQLRNTEKGNLIIAGTIIQTQQKNQRIADAAEEWIFDPKNNGTLRGFNKHMSQSGLDQIYPRPKSAEEVSALPSGTVFVWDGKLEVRQ